MSRKLWWIISAVLIVGGLAVAGSLLASDEGAPDVVLPGEGLAYFSTETLADDQGAVTVAVTQVNLNGPEDTLDFYVALDTHSVNLDMDLAKNAFLTTDTGLTVSPVRWDGPAGGHHVAGTLKFLPTLGDQPVLEGAEQVTLTIRNVDVPERNFIWVLQTPD